MYLFRGIISIPAPLFKHGKHFVENFLHFFADGAKTHSVFAYLPSPSIKLASIAKSVLFLAFGDNLSQLIVIPSGQAHGLLRGTVLLVAG